MRRLFLFISILLFLTSLSSFSAKHLKDTTNGLLPIEAIAAEVIAVTKSDTFSSTINQALTVFTQFLIILDETLDSLQSEKELESLNLEHPQLLTPNDQTFAIHNIELGETKTNVEQQLGEAQRITRNEYGNEWYAYHTNYQQFTMVSYNTHNRVSGLYTNQDLISSTLGINYGSSRDEVIKQLGKPLKSLQKGLTFYEFQDDVDYDMYVLDDSYVTVFYDKYKQNTVTSIQIIDKKQEQMRHEFYTKSSELLKEGFELQLFDLVNATRVNHGLPVLSWDDHVNATARKHSEDMAINHYFNHTNLEGQSPFDRMLADGIRFLAAGENLASGQPSSVFAHEGLMNSLGHRENILHKDFEFLGVGVAFNTQNQPYYTQKFYK